NGEQDGDESAVDCGPTSVCGDCTGTSCAMPSDCASRVCTAMGMCAAPTCSDNTKNGVETGTDCGGANCAPCPANEGCANNDDCQSKVCDLDVCAAPTCQDNVTNGDETDIDCGGSCPVACSIGKACSAPSDCLANSCSGGQCACPSGMEVVPALNGGAYCVDETEVTYLQYEAFFAANPVVGQQIPQCTWNTTYTPANNWPAAADAEAKRFAVRGVNWCQAYAYCAWAGKRMCGSTSGGAQPFLDFDQTSSQWYNACSAVGVNVYPYGAAYDGNRCQDDGVGPWRVLNTSNNAPSMINASCNGGSPNLFDMSGNLREWEDSCDGNTDETDFCRVRGGSYEQNAQGQLRCDANQTLRRDQAPPDVGFRCCLDG
ncbi:MAG: SUMF1/EgtB/PvdO family nonheme iron enzyme, partial [Myxococcota bacterium]